MLTLQILMYGINIFHQGRPSKGGGVSLYCKVSFQCYVLSSKSAAKQFELLLLKNNLSKNLSLTVAGFYRPPFCSCLCLACFQWFSNGLLFSLNKIIYKIREAV